MKSLEGDEGVTYFMKDSKYAYIFSMGIEKAMEYRMDFLLSLMSTVFPIIMQVYMWTALYSAGAADSNGYTYEQMILYTLFAGITAKIVSTGFEVDVLSDIKDGGLNKYLVKPVSYYGYYFASFLGGKVIAVVILLIMTGIVLGISAQYLGIVIRGIQVLAYLISLILALILNFLIYFLISLAGFWITEISKMFGTISIVLVVISGGVFPMDIFGNTIRTLSEILPFSYTTQFSVNIINGRLETVQIGQGFLIQVIWICILAAGIKVIWKRGLKRYVAAGG